LTDAAAARVLYAEEIRRLAELRSERVAQAFAEVRREAFLGPGPWMVWNSERWAYEPTPAADPVHVYRDAPIAIAAERFLNNGQPSFVAKLIDALELQPGDRVVHVGAGTGYFTAIIAAAVGRDGRVIGIELDPELASRARRNLSAWPQATVVDADGCRHDAGAADAILVNAGASAPQSIWLDSLCLGGRLVLPLVRWPDRKEEFAAGGTGIVLRITRGRDGYDARVLGSVVIFPCIGGIDAAGDRNLADGLERLDVADGVRSLRRDPHEREPACWLHGDGYCLSSASSRGGHVIDG
jgi:protein-L-isoaspartate(D-aspartate) O-methyltransferase